MNELIVCQECGHERPSEGDVAVCPSCILKSALTVTRTIQDQQSRFDPPSTEALQREFSGFDVHSLIGQGGMGAVYHCTQKSLNRQVAIKILPLANVRDETFPERFQREAHVIGKMHHPGIVSVFDAGEVEGYLYLVMQYVDGCTLRDLILAGELPVVDVLELITQVGAALQFAHDQGVVHRDIKPENVLIDQNGKIHIADFGIAKLIHADEKQIDLTPTSGGIGTRNYMAPEQCSNTNVDHRADIYSLGVLFYELLTGDLPTVDFTPPSRKRKLDKRIDSIVLKLLKEAPENRFQQATDLISEIERLQTRRFLTARKVLATLMMLIGCCSLLMGVYQQFFSPLPDRGEQIAGESVLPITSDNPPDSTNTAVSNHPGSLFEMTRSEQEFGMISSGVSKLHDLDNDGDLDVFFGNSERLDNAVWLNDGGGRFSQVELPNLGKRAGTCAIIDVDQDGNQDCVLASESDLLVVYLGNGDGTFVTGQSILGESKVPNLVAADLDGDGDHDLIRTSGRWLGADTTRIYFNRDGEFHESSQRFTPSTSWAVAVKDLDGDGSLDFFNATTIGEANQVWLNDGEGQFELSEQFQSHFGDVRRVILEDFDADGSVDVFLCKIDSEHELWLNDGSGTFRPGQTLPDLKSPSSALSADFDHDGDLDLYIGQFNNIPDDIYLNDGHGQFQKLEQTIGQSYSMDCAAGDLNGDGRIDIVIATANDKPDEVWFNFAAGE